MHLGLVFGLTAFYFLLILGFVLYARFKATKSILPGIGEFFLAGRELGPLTLTCTYVASLFSTFSILGMPALFYVHGASGLYFLAITDVLGLAFLYFVGRRLYRAAKEHNVFSPIEIITRAYNAPRLGLLLAFIFILALLPYIALQLVGIGSFIDAYSDGRINYLTGVGSMMVIVILYLFLGGMRAVAYTDLLQLIAMTLGLVFGAAFLCNHYDISVSALLGDIGEASALHFHPPGAKNHFYWPMIITTGLVTFGVFVQPHLLTRAIMAKHEGHIKYMALGTVIGRLIVTALAVFFGAFAFQNYGADLKPNLLMGEVFKDLGGIGLFGLILSVIMLMGALGAAMSTADSLLISIGQVSTRDIIRPFFVLSHKRQVLISKAIMFVVLCASFLIGLNPPPYMTDLAIYSGAISAILAPTLMSFFWQKRQAFAAYCSIAMGGVSLITLGMLKAFYGIGYDNVHIGIFPVAISFLSYYGICLLRANMAKPELANDAA